MSLLLKLFSVVFLSLLLAFVSEVEAQEHEGHTLLIYQDDEPLYEREVYLHSLQDDLRTYSFVLHIVRNRGSNLLETVSVPYVGQSRANVDRLYRALSQKEHPLAITLHFDTVSDEVEVQEARTSQMGGCHWEITRREVEIQCQDLQGLYEEKEPIGMFSNNVTEDQEDEKRPLFDLGSKDLYKRILTQQLLLLPGGQGLVIGKEIFQNLRNRKDEKGGFLQEFLPSSLKKPQPLKVIP